ncbi:MAG: rhodanese-like domain-containing protein [Cytophagaceae bacterium]
MKTKILLLIGVISSLTFLRCNQVNGQQTQSPTVYQQNLQKDTAAILVDVRTPEEYANGHLKNAININYYDASFMKQMAALSKDKTIYVYCRSGGRSGKATQELTQAGYKVVDMAGGITAWESNGLPVVK